MSDVAVVSVDPLEPNVGLIFPFLAHRVLEFSREHIKEAAPEAFSRHLVARVAAGDPDVLLIALVQPDGKVVGHAAAVIEGVGEDRWACIVQSKADQNVGDAMLRVLESVDRWAQSRGAKRLIVSTHNEGMWKRRGFRTYRYVMERDGASSDARA